MDSWKERRRTFDEGAELYDRLRPSYPGRVVDDVAALTAIQPGGSILEVGCGTGQATVLFARRGYSILCLEPGPNLARLAVRNFASFGNVRVEISTFEDWSGPGAAFDLVMAAQVFHLLDPSVRLVKAAHLLRSDGALVVFWNKPQRGTLEVHRRLQEAYDHHAPSLATERPPGEDAALEDQIDDTGLFGTVFMSRYPWSKTYGAQDYVDLMDTQSDHRLLPAAQRSALLHAIGEAISRHGGAITIEYRTQLYVAKRRAV